MEDAGRLVLSHHLLYNSKNHLLSVLVVSAANVSNSWAALAKTSPKLSAS